MISDNEVTVSEDETIAKPADAAQKKHNFHINVWETEKAGPKTRYQWNIDAIRTLKQIESENRLATQEEQKILSKFVSWGGLSRAFDENNESWSKEYKELKELLSDEEYAAARATVNNAFYTSPEIASCINSALMQFGFRGGNILEPSMGIGNFFGSMPQAMQESRLYGVELDSISGRIAKQLYQNANIGITGFENTTYPDNFFDVVVGNVPFGDYKVFDPKYNKYNFRIHDYFLAKALDQVRPGGMVAVITTKGTLDKTNPTIRKYLAERAELVGAVRLPNTAFKANAGAEVTTDILFLQKRERKIDIEPDWVHLGMTENGIAVNSYFAEHPEMMLGSMEYDTRIYGQDSRYTVCVNDDENFNMYEALNKAIGNIKAQMTDFERVADEAEQTEEVIPADPDVRNYTYTFFEGKLYYRENSEMVRKEVSKTAEERIRCLDEIRQITRELIDIQMKGCSEEELSDKQRLLNEKYDSFAKQYGAITSKANRAAFRDDSDYPLLCSLEEVNEDGQVKKADMFYKQTIKAKTVIERVETAVEALNVSVNEFGYVNLAYMLSIYEPDITDELEKLKNRSNDSSEQIPVETIAQLKRTALTKELEAISKCKTGETTAIGKFHGFELLVEKNFLDINYMVLRGKTEYKAELSTSPVGSMVKLENLFNGLHENIDFLEKKIEQYQNDLEASKTEYDKPFAYSKELEEKLARQCELNAQLDLENAKAVDADLSGPEEEREADDRIESAAIVAEDKGAYPADREGRTR